MGLRAGANALTAIVLIVFESLRKAFGYSDFSAF